MVVCAWKQTKTTLVQVAVAQFCRHDFLMTHKKKTQTKRIITGVMQSFGTKLIIGAAIINCELRLLRYLQFSYPTYQLQRGRFCWRSRTSTLQNNTPLICQPFYRRSSVRVKVQTDVIQSFNHYIRCRIPPQSTFSHLVLLCSLNGWQWSRAVSAQLALWQRVGHSLLGRCGRSVMSCWWT